MPPARLELGYELVLKRYCITAYRVVPESIPAVSLLVPFPMREIAMQQQDVNRKLVRSTLVTSKCASPPPRLVPLCGTRESIEAPLHHQKVMELTSYLFGFVGRWPARLTIGLGVGVLIGLLATSASSLRVLLMGAVVALLTSLAFYRPQFAVAVLWVYLPLMGLLRRALIPAAGWSGNDPLLLVAPAIAGLLFLNTVLSRQTAPKTRLSLYVSLFFGLSVLETFNPLQGGLQVSMAGALLFLAPICFFFVGRQFVDDKLARKLVVALIIIGCAASLYGVYQLRYGFTSFEERWIALGGYSSLWVGKTIRPFSTFASGAEYAFYVAGAMAAASALALSRYRWVTLVIPLLLTAAFLAGTRTIMVILVATVAALVGMRTGFTRLAASRILLAAAALVFASRAVLQAMSSFSDVPVIGYLVSHQVNGLLNPLDPTASTATIHAGMVWQGLLDALRNPVGFGIGSITLAAAKYYGRVVSTEFDITNVVLATGWLGGILYLLILLQAYKTAVQVWNASKDPFILATLAVLLANFGQIQNTGQYSTVCVCWVLMGYLDNKRSVLDAVTTSHGGGLTA